MEACSPNNYSACATMQVSELENDIVAEMLHKLSEDLTPEDVESLKLLSKDKQTGGTCTEATYFLDSLRDHCSTIQEFLETLEHLLLKLKKTISFTCGEVFWSEEIKEVKTKYEAWVKEKGLQGTPNFVGRKQYLKILETDFLNTSVKAFCICGLGGLGKSALARELCARKPSWTIKKVELRAKETVKEFLTTVVINLMSDSKERGHMLRVEDMTDLFLKILKDEEENTIIILDDVDKLMESECQDNFLNLIHDILCGMEHVSKVKLLITSRSSLKKEELSFDGMLHEIKLIPLEQHEAEELLQKNSMPCVTLTKQECSDLAQLCGGSPQALLVVADLLKLGDLQPEDMVKRLQPEKLKATATLPPVYMCLQEMFKSLSEEMQCHLVSLSVFDSSFDRDAAYYVFRELQTSHESQTSHERSLCTVEDAKFNLKRLICRHLVDFEDFSVYANVVSLGEKKSPHSAYSLHPLVKDFVRGKAKENSWRHIMLKGKNGFIQFFEQKAKEIHTQRVGIFSPEVERLMSLYLRTYMTIAAAQPIVNHDLKSEGMSAITLTSELIEKFSDLSERKKYYVEVQNRAEQRGDKVRSCYIMLLSARCSLDLEHCDVADALCKQSKLLLQEMMATKSSSKNILVIQRLYHFIHGRLFYKKQLFEDALNSFSECKKYFDKIQGTEVSLDDVNNFIGSVHFSLGQYEKAVECFRTVCQKQKSSIAWSNIAKAYKAMYADKLYKDELCKDKYSKWNFDELFEKSEQHFSGALDILRQNNDFSLTTAVLLKDFADLYRTKFDLQQKEFTELNAAHLVTHKRSNAIMCLEQARTHMEEAVEIAKKRAPPYHKTKLEMMIFRAYILKEMGEYEEKLCEGKSWQHFEECARQVDELSILLFKTPQNEGPSPQEGVFALLEEDVIPVLKKINRPMDLERIRKIIIEYKREHGMEESESEDDSSEDMALYSIQKDSSFSDSDDPDISSPPPKKLNLDNTV